jgi:hypothetical protein
MAVNKTVSMYFLLLIYFFAEFVKGEIRKVLGSILTTFYR